MFSKVVYEWLDAALDNGIRECDFWEMTIAELERYMKSRARVKENQEKELAAHNYILADLIGRSISRLYGSSNKMPTLSEAYPSLFSKQEEEEKLQAKKDDLSALRFRLFAQSYNSKYKEVAVKK